jgi:hypothetical protein
LNAGEGLEVEVRSSGFTVHNSGFTVVLVLAVVLVLEFIVHGSRFAVRRTILAPADLVLSRRYQNGAGRNRRARGRRPIFNATPWAGAGWLFFCVARSTVMIQIAALRSALEKQPTDLR